MIRHYRKRPVVIQAVQFTGDNQEEVNIFTKETSKWKMDGSMSIATLEGEMRVDKGAYIIKGVQGEFYPCKEDIFLATYEQA